MQTGTYLQLRLTQRERPESGRSLRWRPYSGGPEAACEGVGLGATPAACLSQIVGSSATTADLRGVANERLNEPAPYKIDRDAV
jgi:hypothetical protein